MFLSRLCAVVTSFATTNALTGACDATTSAICSIPLVPTMLNAGACDSETALSPPIDGDGIEVDDIADPPFPIPFNPCAVAAIVLPIPMAAFILFLATSFANKSEPPGTMLYLAAAAALAAFVSIIILAIPAAESAISKAFCSSALCPALCLTIFNTPKAVSTCACFICLSASIAFNLTSNIFCSSVTIASEYS